MQEDLVLHSVKLKLTVRHKNRLELGEIPCKSPRFPTSEAERLCTLTLLHRPEVRNPHITDHRGLTVASTAKADCSRHMSCVDTASS